MSTQITQLIAKRRSEGITVHKIDSTYDVKVKVTKADIALAKQGKTNVCVLARAARRLGENVSEAFVYKSAAWLHLVNEDGTEVFVRFIPDTDAKKKIAQFDENGKFEPGVYTLLHPTGSSTLERADDRSKKRKGRHQPSDGKIRRKPKATLRVAWSGI